MTSPELQTSMEFEALKSKITELESAILAKHPTLPTLLQTIHRTLKSYPECVTLLSEQEICSIVKGLEAQTNTFLATSLVKSSKSPSAAKSVAQKLKTLGADAL